MKEFQKEYQLLKTDAFTLYRGTINGSDKSVLLKTANSQTKQHGDRLQYASKILTSFDAPCIIKPLPSLNSNSIYSLFFEDIGANLLGDFVQQHEINNIGLLNILVLCTEALSIVHAQNIIIGWLTPQTIFFDNQHKKVQLFDFSNCSKLDIKDNVIPPYAASALLNIKSSSSLSETLTKNIKLLSPHTCSAGTDSIIEQSKVPLKPDNGLSPTQMIYASPEKLGLIDVKSDKSSDLYSLGVVFYELVTGKKVFNSTDPVELLHAHAASLPIPPTELKRDIPEGLSRIILKLLEKKPENRYCSCSLLLRDLRALRDYKSNNLAQDNRINVENKLFADKGQNLHGRHKEILQLKALFKTLPRNQSSFISVSGFSGTGKTTLVEQASQIIRKDYILYFDGKFSQYNTQTPYLPFIECLQKLTKKILNSNAVSKKLWKTRILESLQNNAQVMIDVVPELSDLLSVQPPLHQLRPAENRARFERCVSQFIKVCSIENHSLLLFFDDMQWADKATLSLLKKLFLDPEIKSFCVVGSYRSEDIEGNGRLLKFLSWLERKDKVKLKIDLYDLPLEHIEDVLLEFLSKKNALLPLLARICKQKTNGNPFYLKQFIYSLFQQNLLWYSQKEESWDFNLAEIQGKSIADNVLSLILSRYDELSISAKTLLEYAACLGPKFDEVTLKTITNFPPATISMLVEDAILKGFLLIVSAETPAIENENNVPGVQKQKTYKFAHDQILQVLYQNMPEAYLQELHLAIGRRLLEQYHHNPQGINLFAVVYHNNIGSVFIRNDKEILQLAQLNLDVGIRALETIAYDIALSYFQKGLFLLRDSGWQSDHQYTLCLNLHIKCAEAFYLSGNYTGMSKIITEVENNARHLLDKIKIYEVEIQSLIAQSHLNQAITKALEALTLLGENIQENPTRLQLLLSYLKTKYLLKRKQVNDLLNLPAMTDPHKLAIMRILFRIGTPAYYKGVDLLALIAFKSIQLTLKHGHNPQAGAVAFTTLAIIQCGVLNDVENGYESGKTALKLQNKYSPKSTLPASQYLFSNLIQPWREHLRETLQPLQETYYNALEVGETEQAALALYSYSHRLLLLGDKLDGLYVEVKKSYQTLVQIGQEAMMHRQSITLQLVHNLIEPVARQKTFSGKHYDEKLMVPIHLESGDKTTLFQLFFMKLLQNYLLGNYKEALSAADNAKNYIKSSLASAFLPQYFFYYALTLLALYDTLPQHQRKDTQQKVKKIIRKLNKWSTSAPMNYRHMYNLIKAQSISSFSTNPHGVETYYEKAINGAKDNGFLQQEAIAYECAASYYYKQGLDLVADTFLLASYSRFKSWGCSAKIKMLLTSYENLPKLLANRNLVNDTSQNLYKKTEPEQWLDSLDAQTIIKASQHLATEIQLEEYLKSMLQIMIENARAVKGYLFCQEGEQWIPYAKGVMINGEIESSIYSSEVDTILPHSIINDVAKIKKQIIIKDALNDSIYKDDVYVRSHNVRSMLSMPVEYQNKIICILFLENNLINGAFSSERVELLKYLGYQAAISLRNSILYRELENAVKKMELEIEEHQKTQQQLLHAEKLTAMGKISASIAHEVGNPLLGIKFLLTDLKKSGELSSDKNKLLDIGIRECQRLQEMIKKLRHLYQTSTSKPEILDLNNLIDDTFLFYRKHLNSRKISLEKKYDKKLPFVFGVKDQIVQVISNLLLNAVNSIDDNQGDLEISTGVSEKEVYFCIKDSGKGMNEAEQKNIFEPFYSTKSDIEGAGLGLSVTYSIIENHNGTITVQSVPGVGSSFTVSLPRN